MTYDDSNGILCMYCIVGLDLFNLFVMLCCVVLFTVCTLPKKGKFSFQKCAQTNCNFPAMTGSCYCSGACAAAAVPLLWQALLAYRNNLVAGSYARSSQAATASVAVAVAAEEDEIAAAFFADVASFRCAFIDPDETNKEMNTSLHKGKFIPKISTEIEPTQSDRSLVDLLSAAEKVHFSSRSSLSSLSSPRASLAGLAALTTALPAAAANVVLKSDDAPDDGTGSSLAQSSPRASADSNTSSSSSGGGGGDIRKMVRFSFEETFVAALMRIHAKGAYSLGAVLALELETELFNKYCVFHSGHASSTAVTSTRPEFNKKDYRKHQLMLQRNLKQSHNDHLVHIYTSFH